MLISDTFDWIFFDCFNTLIDDFDETGDESGIAPMYHVPVEMGLYDDRETFRRHYHEWRKLHISGKGTEQTIEQRLRNVLQTYRPDAPADQIESAVMSMATAFAANYPSTLRLPAGVHDMLEQWQGKVRMGVVSNFFWAYWPEKFLVEYKLRKYFNFVLDSAACGWRKPGLEIYQAALDRAGSPAPGRVLFIGDHLNNDVLTPIQLGMQAIHFDRSQERPKSLRTPAGLHSITQWDQFRLPAKIG